MESDIIIPYKYAYFFGSLYLFAIWLFFYWRIPEIRKILIFFSISIVWLGLIAEYLWFLRDWWHPITLTGTKLGVEDFIASMTHLTLPAFLYKYVFSKKVEKLVLDKKDIKNFFFKLTNIFIVFVFSLTLLHYYFKLHIAWTFVACFFILGMKIIARRNDLLIPALWSGILFDLIFFILYTFGNLFSPGVFDALWDKSVLAEARIFHVPIVDYIFYFFWGFVGGVIYEYIFELKIKNSTGPGLLKDLKKINRLI